MSAQKTAIITGGASGMGESIARNLAHNGYHVALWDIAADKAGDVANSIRNAGGLASGHKVDVTRRDEVVHAYKALQDKTGTATVLVNAAGLGLHKPLLEHTAEDFDRNIALNLTGTFNTIWAASPGMVAANWGRIVNIASLAGQAGVGGMAAYSAAKAGVIGLSKAVARELGSHGVTCNVISPGAIDTPMLRRSMERGAIAATRETTRAVTLMGRIGTVEEISAAALYYISNEASFVTGQVLGVNGGEYM